MEILHFSVTCITALASLVAAVASCVRVYRIKKIKQLELATRKTKKELLNAYKNIKELLEEEKELCEKAGVSKKSIRTNRETDKQIEPKRVLTRIKELEQEIMYSESVNI